MKTYRIDPEKALSIRWHLVASFVATFVGGILAVLIGGYVSGTTGSPDGIGMAVLFIAAGLLWSAYAYWRAVWNLWEWAGLALALGITVAIAILSAISGGILGIIANLVWFFYIVSKVSRQCPGAKAIARREVFED